jgi:hypothetical protein
MGSEGDLHSSDREFLLLIIAQEPVQFVGFHTPHGLLDFTLIMPIIGLHSLLRFPPISLDEQLKVRGV